MAFQLTSPAFSEGGEIPGKHTCDGEDVSPVLEWGDPPADTRSLALICDDPDAPAGTWVHWVLYNLPANARKLPEGVATKATLPDGSRQGLNDFRKTGYGGPCPPPGPAHRYYFKLYALRAVPDLKPSAMKKDLLRAMEGQILAESQLMGRYQRRR